MDFYDEISAEIVATLDEFGTDVILRSVAVYPTALSAGVRHIETVEWTRKGILADCKKTRDADSVTRIQEKTKRIIIRGGGVEPQTDDVLSVKGEDWIVTECTTVSPGGKDLLFIAQVRK